MIFKFLKQLFCFPHHYEQELSPFLPRASSYDWSDIQAHTSIPLSNIFWIIACGSTHSSLFCKLILVSLCGVMFFFDFD